MTDKTSRDETTPDPHALTVAEGVILGEAFRITAYTWKDRPRKGVRFDVFIDGLLSVQSASAEHVIGHMAAQITRAVDSLEASNAQS